MKTSASLIRNTRAQFQTELDALLASIRSAAERQFAYSLEQNVPRGILTIDEVTGHALDHGLVSTISNRLEYGTSTAMRFCADILEDVNCHREAAQLTEWAKKEEADAGLVSDLISSAAEATEHFSDDELEAHAAKLKTA